LTEPVIAAAQTVAAAAIQAAVKELTPEAEQLLRELESVAKEHFDKLEAAIPPLVDKAEGASAHAVHQAQQFLGGLLGHLRSVLGAGAPASGVDPTTAPTAAPPTQS
jgi:hypothetical protein